MVRSGVLKPSVSRLKTSSRSLRLARCTKSTMELIRSGTMSALPLVDSRSEEHTSELQSLMRISYAVFCLKKKTTPANHTPSCHFNTPYVDITQTRVTELI